GSAQDHGEEEASGALDQLCAHEHCEEDDQAAHARERSEEETSGTRDQLCAHERCEEGSEATGARDHREEAAHCREANHEEDQRGEQVASPEEARVEEGTGAEGTSEQGSGTQRSRLINRSSRAGGGYAPDDMRFETFGIV